MKKDDKVIKRVLVCLTLENDHRYKVGEDDDEGFTTKSIIFKPNGLEGLKSNGKLDNACYVVGLEAENGDKEWAIVPKERVLITKYVYVQEEPREEVPLQKVEG